MEPVPDMGETGFSVHSSQRFRFQFHGMKFLLEKKLDIDILFHV